jgi:uncharacterized protein (TIGR00369 family)
MHIDQVDNPFLHMLGTELLVWQPGLAELALRIAPAHLNRQGRLQGGVIASLLDAACGYSALYAGPGAAPRHASTLQLSVSFLAPISSGSIRATGTRTGGGKHIYFAQGRIVSETGILIATAQASFKFQSTPVAATP